MENRNKLHIEKFTEKKKIIIQQDFYSHIYFFNVLIALKHDAENHKKCKSNIQDSF